ncbi:MAG: DUF192 domain-containing protein [Candidatus Micrarchaeaceae archaeon]
MKKEKLTKEKLLAALLSAGLGVVFGIILYMSTIILLLFFFALLLVLISYVSEEKREMLIVFTGAVVLTYVFAFTFAFINYMNHFTIPLSAFPVGEFALFHHSIINGSEWWWWTANENIYKTYLATTPIEQTQGFMNQSTSGLGNMVFIFNNDSSHCFWMKNTEFPLTVAWINQSGYVQFIANMQAENTTPICADGKYVLESTEFNDTNTISIGDYIEIYDQNLTLIDK